MFLALRWAAPVRSFALSTSVHPTMVDKIRAWAWPIHGVAGMLSDPLTRSPYIDTILAGAKTWKIRGSSTQSETVSYAGSSANRLATGKVMCRRHATGRGVAYVG